MMKRLAVLICYCVMCLMLCGCCVLHDWQEASCDEAKHCLKCAEQQGEALGHDWLEATCIEPETCSRCGMIEGEPLGHWLEPWQLSADDASVIERKCKLCGEIISRAMKVEINKSNYMDFFDFYYGDVVMEKLGNTDPFTHFVRAFYCELKKDYAIADTAENEVTFDYEYDFRLRQYYGGTEIDQKNFDVLGTAINDEITDYNIKCTVWNGDRTALFGEAIVDDMYVMFHTCENMTISNVNGYIYLAFEE